MCHLASLLLLLLRKNALLGQDPIVHIYSSTHGAPLTFMSASGKADRKFHVNKRLPKISAFSN